MELRKEFMNTLIEKTKEHKLKWELKIELYEMRTRITQTVRYNDFDIIISTFPKDKKFYWLDESSTLCIYNEKESKYTYVSHDMKEIEELRTAIRNQVHEKTQENDDDVYKRILTTLKEL